MIQIIDLKIKVRQTTDASEHAVAAIISQECHPLIYLSRKFTAKTNYLNRKRKHYQYCGA